VQRGSCIWGTVLHHQPCWREIQAPAIGVYLEGFIPSRGRYQAGAHTRADFGSTGRRPGRKPNAKQTTPCPLGGITKVSRQAHASGCPSLHASRGLGQSGKARATSLCRVRTRPPAVTGSPTPSALHRSRAPPPPWGGRLVRGKRPLPPAEAYRSTARSGGLQ
jgi:hypothetical protein